MTVSFVITAELWRPEVTIPGIFWSNLCFLQKTTPYGKIFKILFRKFTWRHGLTFLCWNDIKFFRREIGEIMCYLPIKKFRLPLKLSLLCGTARIVPKICQGQSPTFGSKCSKFHPNWFTFGRVIAECAKAVLLAHRVFAIFARTSGK